MTSGEPHNHKHHSHGFSSRHEGGASTAQRGLLIALVITALFTVAEFVGGYLANSLALIADAGHMLSDVAALGLSLFAVWFTARPATPAKTFGYFRGEILAALLNGSTLIAISLWIVYEAYQRMAAPPEVRSGLLLAIASVGLLANLVCAWVLHRSQHESLNVQAAFLHVIGDIFGSVGAILAGILIWRFQWYRADPLISVLVKEAVAVLLEGTPSHINITQMRQELAKVAGVESIHDLHVWTLTSGVHMMSCHAVIQGAESHTRVLQELSRITRERFSISHTTIQVEEQDRVQCDTSNCH
jgi:cobalt-zinc-cadmium efflux system protein